MSIQNKCPLPLVGEWLRKNYGIGYLREGVGNLKPKKTMKTSNSTTT